MDTLSEYLEAQKNGKYFSGFHERLAIANEFISAFNSNKKGAGRGKEIIPHLTPFMNPDTLVLRPVRNDETGETQYCVSVDESRTPQDMNEEYNNAEFAPRSVHFDKSFLGKERPATVRDFSKPKIGGDEALIIISKLLFCILFCHHPFKGRDYYDNSVYSRERDFEFFMQPRKFIFDLNENTNRFVNGYHENARVLWECLSAEQKQFFFDAFYGKFDCFTAGFEAWHSAYFCNSEGTAIAPCGNKFKTVLFNDEHVIVLSENRAAVNEIYCKSNTDSCKNCTEQKKYAGMLTKRVWLLTSRPSDEAGVNVLTIRDAFLYSGKDISGGDFGKESDVAGKIFTVVTSKNNDLLGLKYLGDNKVTAICGQTGRIYSNGETVALLAGTVVMVSPKCWISVPNPFLTKEQNK